MNQSLNQKKDIQRFTLVMFIFTFGMAGMILYDVSAWWIWYLYFAVWTLIEWRIAQNIKLKWWYWVLIIIGILILDIIVVEFVEYFFK
ncbi:MAG: hypothetical protein HKN51_15445 [Saprospiraceae bacterium]|nr:hypothetical protein [Saprospiraceae bacterium]